MRVLHWILLFAGIACGYPPVTFAQEASPVDLESRINEVTVYQGQADVTRNVSIPPNTELRWFRIQGLPTSLKAESVRWESDDQIIVRSLRVLGQSDAAGDPGEKNLRAEAVEELEQATAEADQRVAVIEQDLETLQQLVQFSSVNFKDQLNTA